MNDFSKYKILFSNSIDVFLEGWNSSGIYAIIGLHKSDTFKNTWYIGSSINLQSRIRGHFSALDRKKHSNFPLQYAYNKHGKNNFIVILIERCTPENCLDREQFYLDKYRPFVDEFNGYNINHYSESTALGLKHTPEARKKMSDALKGLVKSDEWKRKLSIANLGHKDSFKTRKKKSISRQGSKNPMFGVPKPANAGSPDKQYHLISPNGQVFKGQNITHFAKAQNLNLSKVSEVVNGKRKHHKGWTLHGRI